MNDDRRAANGETKITNVSKRFPYSFVLKSKIIDDERNEVVCTVEPVYIMPAGILHVWRSN